MKQLVEIKLDLGCGQSSREGFIGVDLNPNADLQWDINWGLPFHSESVAEIRSDHFLEHLELQAVVRTLCECRRVLKVGGILEFSVPHFDVYLNAYINKDINFLITAIDDLPPGQDHLYSTCFDRIFWVLHRGGEHRSIFDRESIISKVSIAGFSRVDTRDFDPDRDCNRRFSSVYVLAVK